MDCDRATRARDNRHVRPLQELSSPTSQPVGLPEGPGLASVVFLLRRLAGALRPRKQGNSDDASAATSIRATASIAVSETLGAYFYGDISSAVVAAFGNGAGYCGRAPSLEDHVVPRGRAIHLARLGLGQMSDVSPQSDPQRALLGRSPLAIL